MSAVEDGPQLTLVGKLFMVLFLGACGFGAWWLFVKKDASPLHGTPANGQTDTVNKGEQTVIRIAYGTEKERWLKWAVEEFEKTKSSQNYQVELLPLGSLEGSRATVSGEQEITVWSPASSAYREVFAEEWRLKFGDSPAIIREETLALSPMVFVVWKERYEAFASKYGKMDFFTTSQALAEPGGWGGIAQRPEWGFFKFGHTNPNQSNSGLITLALMAHHFHGKATPLQLADIVDPAFQTWLKSTERAVSGLISSTGTMMKDMVLKGPASYDAIFVYENVAIDYLENAKGRWGELTVIYPKYNIWNDNPYYIIDGPWVSRAQKVGAGLFLDFLMSEPIQAKSLEHGFRPGNPAIAINGVESPFSRYQAQGIQIELPIIVETPTAPAINNLLTGWQRLRN